MGFIDWVFVHTEKLITSFSILLLGNGDDEKEQSPGLMTCAAWSPTIGIRPLVWAVGDQKNMTLWFIHKPRASIYSALNPFRSHHFQTPFCSLQWAQRKTKMSPSFSWEPASHVSGGLNGQSQWDYITINHGSLMGVQWRLNLLMVNTMLYHIWGMNIHLQRVLVWAEGH